MLSLSPDLRRIVRALGFLSPHRAVVAAILALTLFLGGLGALEPLVLKHLFDGLAGGSDAARSIALGLAALVGLALVREAIGGFNNWLNWRTRIGVQYALLEATVDRLHRTSLDAHRTEGTGAILTKMDRGIQGFVGAIWCLAFELLPSAAYLVLAVVIMFQLEPRLAALVLFFAPLPALTATLAAPEQTRRERLLMGRWARIYSRFNEVISGLLTVKSFAMEEAEKKRFLGDVDEANRVVVRGVARDTSIGGLQNLFQHAARLTSIGAGCWLVLSGETTIGTVIAFQGYVGGLFGPVQSLSGIYKTMRTASASLEVVFGFLDADDHIPDIEGAREAAPLRGEVVFEHVSFQYRAGAPQLLDDIDFHVQPGQLIAVVGPSGSGKTTMMALLQRLYDPSQGRVLVDGEDVRHLRQHSLRRQIGVVLQDALLFNDSVLHNITYGRPGAEREEAEAAARAAQAHDFVIRLPDGYDTVVGERGGRLSAGERQRIAIARALLKDPAVLILDEATSALDAESEALVQEAIERLVAGRTTFVIAHRLATVVHADRILVLKDGRILEAGDHAGLLARGGYYASLVEKQTRPLRSGEGRPSGRRFLPEGLAAS